VGLFRTDLRYSSGSFATLAAIRRASSLVNNYGRRICSSTELTRGREAGVANGERRGLMENRAELLMRQASMTSLYLHAER
jgi:hypothetical protein